MSTLPAPGLSPVLKLEKILPRRLHDGHVQGIADELPLAAGLHQIRSLQDIEVVGEGRLGDAYPFQQF